MITDTSGRSSSNAAPPNRMTKGAIIQMSTGSRMFWLRLGNNFRIKTPPTSQMANNPVQQLADRKLIGTGPYKLAGFEPNQSVTLAAFDDYWGGKPRFREVVLKNVPEASTRIAELQSGATQIVGDVPPSKIPEIERIPGYERSFPPHWKELLKDAA